MKTYLVKFWGGGGGWFVQQLITHCELQTEESAQYPRAHAHDFGWWVNQTYDNTDKTSDHYRLKPNSQVDFIIARGDGAMTSRIIYDRDPDNFGMVNIVSETSLDVALAEFNHFYKNQIYGTQDYGLYPHYLQLIDPASTAPPSWIDVPTEAMTRVLIARTQARWGDPSSNDLRSSIHYRQLNQVFQVPNREIGIQAVMWADDELLTMVSELVGKPITRAMRRTCRAYGHAQQELLRRWPAYNNMLASWEEWRPDQGQK